MMVEKVHPQLLRACRSGIWSGRRGFGSSELPSGLRLQNTRLQNQARSRLALSDGGEPRLFSISRRMRCNLAANRCGSGFARPCAAKNASWRAMILASRFSCLALIAANSATVGPSAASFSGGISSAASRSWPQAIPALLRDASPADGLFCCFCCCPASRRLGNNTGHHPPQPLPRARF
jgi:hypothetical protein